jgi:D-alanyl-D-alanine carboxypeptidase
MRSVLARTCAYGALALAISLILAPSARAGPTLLFDAANGAVLYAEDLDTPWHPASLTKMMTAYVTFVAIQEGTLALDTPIGCSNLANGQGPTKLGLPVGATITVETALQALIMKSANDVAVMLAEAVSGSHEAFVDYMNGMAGRLGMTRTKFANANGLPDPDQVTTARDMGKLAAAIVRDFHRHHPRSICTAIPPSLSPINSHSPVWTPARTLTPSVLTASAIARPHRTARAGPSNLVACRVDLTPAMTAGAAGARESCAD